MVKKIAITGGIGSGKSVVLQYIAELGYPAFSCDIIYKELLQSAEFAKSIAVAFPSCIKNGEIDRKILADIVFNNKKQLNVLNAISHPIIMKKLYEEMDKCESKIAFAEVPLLFEGGYEKGFHETIYVKRNIEERIKAIILRDKTDRNSALQRIQSQFNPDSQEGLEKLKNQHVFIVDNNTTIQNLRNQIDSILQKLFI